MLTDKGWKTEEFASLGSSYQQRSQYNNNKGDRTSCHQLWDVLEHSISGTYSYFDSAS